MLTPSISRSLLFASLLLASAGPRLCSQSTPTSQVIVVDAKAPARPFPHYWEKMFGSGRAILSLRESYRRDLREVKEITDFEYIRFHAIFHDEVGLYNEDAQGNPIYNFSYIDQIYDGLLQNHVRPFVEISFMPRALASNLSPHAFWYKPFPAPPKDYSTWDNLISHFAQHLIARYGIDEVSQWYFEVWNEPNIDFWTGEPKEATYYELYDHTARALKSANPRLRVGGPATAQAAWVDRFIQHCASQNVPVDFVSTHVYSNDRSEDVFGTHESISRKDMVCRAVRKVHDQVKASAKPGLPLIWSEFNASYMNEPGVTDTEFMGPWMANTIRDCDGIVDLMSYWSFSDVFEEQGVVKQPFYGGFGLLAVGGIPKPAFNVFKVLHRLGERRIMVSSETALATMTNNDTLEIALWNYAAPEEAGTAKEFILQVRNHGGQKKTARIYRVDQDHGSPLAAYQAMGRPQFPTREQIEKLKRAAALPDPEVRKLDQGEIRLQIPPHGLVLVEVP